MKLKLAEFARHLPHQPPLHRTRSRRNFHRMYRLTVIPRPHRYRVARRSKEASACRVLRLPCRRPPPRPHLSSSVVPLEATIPILHRLQRRQTCIRCAHQRRPHFLTIANGLFPDKNLSLGCLRLRCKLCSSTTRVDRRRIRLALRIKLANRNWWAYGRRRHRSIPLRA